MADLAGPLGTIESLSCQLKGRCPITQDIYKQKNRSLGCFCQLFVVGAPRHILLISFVSGTIGFRRIFTVRFIRDAGPQSIMSGGGSIRLLEIANEVTAILHANLMCDFLDA